MRGLFRHLLDAFIENSQQNKMQHGNALIVEERYWQLHVLFYITRCISLAELTVTLFFCGGM